MFIEPAGLQKISLIDYPGKISCVVFTSGCNFHCPFCHNPDLAHGRSPAPISLGDLADFLLDRRKLLDAVVISGGEPTLAPYLEDICRTAHDLDLLVKLDTNGSHPEILASLIEKKWVDYFAMDIKTLPERYGELTDMPQIDKAVKTSIDLIRNHCPAYEFRTTCVRPFIDDNVIRQIGTLIQGARLFVLQSLRDDIPLLDPQFSSNFSRGYDAAEMARLQAIAAPWVTRCRLR